MAYSDPAPRPIKLRARFTRELQTASREHDAVKRVRAVKRTYENGKKGEESYSACSFVAGKKEEEKSERWSTEKSLGVSYL